MTPWWLTIAAFALGFLFGGFILSLVQAGSRADREMQQAYHEWLMKGWDRP